MSFFRARAGIETPYGYMVGYGYLNRVTVQRQGWAGLGMLYLRERQPGLLMVLFQSQSNDAPASGSGSWKDRAAVL